VGELLKADLYRIIKSKLFLVALIIAAVFPVLTVLMYLLIDKMLGSGDEISSLFGIGINARMIAGEAFSQSSNMGLILTIFITILIGLDVSDGMLRNKIIAGRSRQSIYFSHLITSGIISGAIMLMYALIMLLFGCLCFGYGVKIDGAELVRIVFFLVTGVFTFFFSASVSTAFALSVNNIAPAVIFSVLTGMGLSLITSLVHTFNVASDNKWLCLIPTYTNGSFLSSGSFDTLSFSLGILSYLVLGALVTILGLNVFKKKDVK
jgi:ABC-type transport system involved in multi-copper enzyme maturation permease subunit